MDQALHYKWKQNNLFKKISSQTGPIEALELQKIKNELETLSKNGFSYTYWGHKNYPRSFYQMKNPPYFLSYYGEPVWNRLPCLSIVGSRDYHDLSRQWIQTELNEFLDRESVCTVSGGAIGIDQLVHLSSLKINKPTVVVIPSGLGMIYPRQLNDLKKQIADSGGAIISEFEFEAPVRKHFFFFRNRLIAGFSKMCLVIECKIKSGTFLTVHHALENGRVVAAIPSHPMLQCFSGNQLLLQDGAICITSAQDLSENFRAECWSSLDMNKNDYL